MNSSRTSDSVILADSGVGCSGSDLGLPYTTAGTLRRRQKDSWHREKRAEMMLTLLAGFTRVAYQSGLFFRSISYLVTSAFASWNASSTCNKSSDGPYRIKPIEIKPYEQMGRAAGPITLN